MSKNIVLDVENVSKQYRLGEVGTGTLQHDIKRWWANVTGKEDPYLKIGETNDRTQKGDSDYVWALKDINFQVEQGQAVGIIGRNGAGKSTLLKLLSRVTKPTTGSIKYKGRIASLLEVGTGFHPEMTGRENIYLNEAILGMTRKEITRKFDEIVDFAGVERYIDTPVKRYSSGMYVRLAFAVAAHLESEILIVDEVLAVGDAEFQKKCLGKMNDVTQGEGRTILFVSHNMMAVRKLCNRGILLKNGGLIMDGNTVDVLDRYDLEFNAMDKNFRVDYPVNNSPMQILNVELKKPNTESTIIFIENQLQFTFEIDIRENIPNAYITIDIKDSNEELIYWTSDYTSQRYNTEMKGKMKLVCNCPTKLLTAGSYLVQFAIFSPSEGVVDYHPEYTINFEIEENENTFLQQFNVKYPGKLAIESDWKLVEYE